MTFSRLLSCCAAAALLAGCAQLPRHEVDISNQLRQRPIQTVVLMPIVFPTDLERDHPDDFPELGPENIAATEEQILRALTQSIGASITIDSAFVPGPEAREWSNEIGKNLALDRVPLAVPPLEMGVESVLITAVISYGSELNQYNYQLLPFLHSSKRRYFGKPRWDYICDLGFLLIRPKDGYILCHVRHNEKKTLEERSPDVLGDMTATTVQVISTALQGGEKP